MTINMNYLPSAEDNKKFEEIYNATIAATGEEGVAKYYKDTGKRWRDIARVWDKLISCHERMVFAEAIHHLHWGFYTMEYQNSEFKALLTLVEEEIVRKGEAFRMWSTWRTFTNTFDRVVDNVVPFGHMNRENECHFLMHHFYLRARTSMALLGNGTAAEEALVHDYEMIIHRLIPEAKTWTKAQWSNDLTVAEALQKHYGVDYTERIDDFNRLVEFLQMEWGTTPKDDYLWYVMAMEVVPNALVSVIWTENAQSKIENLFVESYRKVTEYHKDGCPNFEDVHKYFNPDKVYHSSFLKNGWLYKNVSKWFYAGTCCSGLDAEIKQALFV